MMNIRIKVLAGSLSLSAAWMGCSSDLRSGIVTDIWDFGLRPEDMIVNSQDMTSTYKPIQPAFQAPLFYPVDQPWSIAVGDFNGDRNLDAAVTAGSNGVGILLGNGLGSMSTVNYFPAGRYASMVAVADFDLDRRLDLAVVSGASAVSILLGDGLGRFGPPTTLAADRFAYSVTVGDFNLDHNPDLALANSSESVSVLLGDGRGGFGVAASFPVDNVRLVPSSILVADFNLDAKPDLVIGNSGVSILLGDGLGGFAAANYHGLKGFNDLAVGDFNSDGKPDVATSDPIVLLGDGVKGLTRAPRLLGVKGGYGIVVGDFNEDQKFDLVIASNLIGSPSIHVLAGNGLGGFGSASRLSAGFNSNLLTVGDFNGDQKPDLIVSHYSNNKVSVHLSLGGVMIP